MTVPQEAIDAAIQALLAYWGNPPWGADEVREPVTRVLEVVAPLIAAAERERISVRLEQLGDDLRSDIAACNLDLIGES